MSGELRVIPVEGLPEVTKGMKVGQLIAERAQLQDDDIVVISQKVVSKAEGRVRRLAEVEPSERAEELENELGKEASSAPTPASIPPTSPKTASSACSRWTLMPRPVRSAPN